MPIRPQIEEFNPKDEFNLSDMTYSNPTAFITQAKRSAADNVISHALRATNIYGIPDEGFTDLSRTFKDVDNTAVSKDTISELQKGRPGLEIPNGSRNSTAQLMKRQYDDRRYYDFVGQHLQPGSMATISAFGGSLIGSAADLPALIVGEGASLASLDGYRAIAKSFSNHAGTEELGGKGFAKVGTAIMENAARGAGGFGGFQIAQELGEQNERLSLGQPFTWTESAAKVAQAISFGAKFGGILGATGMMAEKAFSEMPEKYKNVISSEFKATSPEAEMTSRVDSNAQMYNGNTPNVDLILRQGMIDEGKRFQAVLDDNGIKTEEFTKALTDSKINIAKQIEEVSKLKGSSESFKDLAQQVVSEIRSDPEREINTQKMMNFLRERLRLSPEQSIRLQNVARKFIPELAKKSEVFSQKNIEKDIRAGLTPRVDIPEEVKTRLSQRAEVSRLNQQIDSLKREFARGKTKKPLDKRAAKLEAKRDKLKEKIKDIPTVSEEIDEIESKLRPEGKLKPGFKNTRAYKRLLDLSRISNKARNKIMEYNLSHEKTLLNFYERLINTTINHLHDQNLFADTVLRHANNGHEPVLNSDVKAYADHIRSRNVEPIDYRLPGEEDLSIDEVHNSTPMEQIEAIADESKFGDLGEDMKEIKRKLGNIDKLREMSRTITKCILGSILR